MIFFFEESDVRKRRRARTAYTSYQIVELQKEFERNR
jgi:hypothetical protein